MKKITRWEVGTYFITVFLTGMAVLIVEVAAVRQLTPVFGGSIYVLSSVLSVILLALSLGYFVGGRLADKYPDSTVLYYIITTSGLSLLALQAFSIHSLADTQFISLVVGPLAVSLAFFFVPALMLGMDSPYVIKLITHNSDESESGKYVGTTFFWSTIGSIIGSLAAGFLLLPFIGVQATITYTALLLVVLGASAPLWLAKRDWLRYLKIHIWYFVIVALLTVMLIVLIEKISKPGPDVLFHTDGLYSQILVKTTEHEGRPSRTLRRDTNQSSAIFIGSIDHVFPYSQFADLYNVLVNNPKHFLLLGGGAYTIPRRLVALDEDLQVDVVEIEPILYELAQEYFELNDTSRITNYVQDARIFLAETDRKYDVVFSDAFNTAHTMPWQLGTLEFYDDLKNVMNSEGVLILNYIGGVDTDPNNMTSAFLNTLQQSFAHVALYKSRTLKEDDLQNLMFIASNQPIETERIRNFMIDTKYNGKLTLEELEVDITRFEAEGRRVFTDDTAPVEFLMGKQFQKYIKAF